MTKGATLASCIAVFLGFVVSAAGSKASAAALSATQAKHTETYEEEVFPAKHRVQHRLKTRGAHAAHHRKSISTPVVTAAAPPAVVALSGPSSVETASDSDSPVLPDVPKAANMGSDGYPHLPPVSGMLASASATLKNINSQASVLEERIVRVQRENEAKMTRQKAVFEQKLKTQEEGNRKEENLNTKLAQEIATLKDGNKVLRTHAKELQAGNAQMREELHVLQAKLTTAREFVSQSLISTDDSKAKELGVLEMKKATTVVSHGRHRKHGHHEVHNGKVEDLDDDQDDDDDIDDDKDDDVAEAASFLAVKVKRSTRTGVAAKAKSDSSSDEDGPDDVDDDASDSKSEKEDEESAGAAAAQARVTEPAHAAVDKPAEIVRVLSAGVESLATEERQSEAQLKAMFLKGFEAGTRRHAALISQQKALNSTKRSLEDLQAGLKEAETHLLSTKSRLQQRVHAAGLFLQKLGHLALAPVAEVPQLIKSFPSEVMAKAKKADSSTVGIADIQK